MNRDREQMRNLDPHDAPTVDLGDPMNQGVELTANDPLPDIPDAGDDSQPITSENPIDFSTAGITAAGAAGMSTFNDGDDQTLFERTVDVFEQSGLDSPMLGDQALTDTGSAGPSTTRARIY